MLGGHLASATNPTEYKFLQQMTKDAHVNIAWLGGFYLPLNIDEVNITLLVIYHVQKVLVAQLTLFMALSIGTG